MPSRWGRTRSWIGTKRNSDHGRHFAMTFEFTAGDSDDDGEEDGYTSEQILTDKPDPTTPGGRLYKVRWKGFPASQDSWEPLSSFVPRCTIVWLDCLKKEGDYSRCQGCLGEFDHARMELRRLFLKP